MPRGVWVLGFVSLCMDLSSELIHALLPLYMATVLGASVFVIGIIEGVAEAIALIVKLFSGVLSDFFAPAQAAGAAGLRPRGGVQVRVSAGADARLDRRRAFCRPRRQGHPRRAARCADRRHHAAGRARRAASGCARRSIPSAASAGRCWRSARWRYFAGDFQAAFWVAVVPAMLCGAADRRRRRRAGRAGGSQRSQAGIAWSRRRAPAAATTHSSSRSPAC